MDNNLLLVDDDKELCSMLRNYLALEGFKTDVLHNGESAAEQAITGQYNLVILDIMLPGQSGFEVLKAIRDTSAVPVLMLTARGEDVDSVVGLELGADDYLSKPFTDDELLIAVNGGILVKHGETLALATRMAVKGELGSLRSAVEKFLNEVDEKERKARTAVAKMEADLIRRFVEFGKNA